QRCLSGHHRHTGLFQEADEAHQPWLEAVHLEAQRAAHRQVLLGAGADRSHRAPAGQGRANVRSASWSTFAYTAVASWLRCRSTCPTSASGAPARSIWVASVCLSRWAPSRGRQALRHARAMISRTTEVDIGWYGGRAVTNNVRQ